MDFARTMKQVSGIIIRSLAFCLASLAIQAANPIGQDNPYTVIAGHNPFGLNPPPPAVEETAKTPPPLIILNGLAIMSGDKRALFKTWGPGGGKSYFLAEGEQRDGIEVLSVNIKASTVTVNNHGVVQTISICPTPALPATVIAAPNGAARLKPGGNNPGEAPAANFSVTANETQPSANGQISQSGIALGTGGSRDGGSQSGGSSNDNAAASDPADGSSGSMISDYTVQGYHWWTKEAQGIEQARGATAQQVMNGSIPPYPLTPFTPPGTPAQLIGPNRLYFSFDPMAPSND